MKTKYVFKEGKVIAHYENNELVWYDETQYGVAQSGPMIMPDIKPYLSMQDGSIINSRSTHREHLKQYGLIEVGNEYKRDQREDMTKRGIPRLSGLKDEIIQNYQRLK